jgi:hypothetical protein
MATIREVTYFNSFIVKKLVEANVNTGGGIAVWPGLPWNPNGYPTFPNRVSTDVYPVGDDDVYMWYIEESRIRGGYNQQAIPKNHLPMLKPYLLVWSHLLPQQHLSLLDFQKLLQ